MKPDNKILFVVLLMFAMFIAGRYLSGSSSAKKIMKIRDELQQVYDELDASRERQLKLLYRIDSLKWENGIRKKRIDSLESEINQSKHQYGNEIKSIPTWSDAKRDSFWRAESAR